MKLLLQEPDAIALRIELDSMFAANRIPGELLVPAPPRVQDLLRPLDEPCFDYRLVIDDARLGLVADAASRGEVTDSRASRRTTVDTGGQAGA